MSRLTSKLVSLVAFGMFGLSGGLLYGSCIYKECTQWVFEGYQYYPWLKAGYEFTHATHQMIQASTGIIGGQLQPDGPIAYRYREELTGCQCTTGNPPWKCTNSEGGYIGEFQNGTKYKCTGT